MEQLLFNGLDRVRGWNVDPPTGLGIAIAFVALMAFFYIRARRNYLAMPELAECAPQAQPPDCMVIIPARNEAAIVGRAVRSLPHDSVIVVDDQSTDETVQEAEEAGAGVLQIAELPRGAAGKPYACMIGSRAIRSKWMLFADADTWYEDGMLESVIHAADSTGLSFVSVHLKIEPESIAEHVLTPYAQALFFAAINPRKCPEGAFYGHCILVRREAYEFIGGHGANLGSLLDDVRLAQLAQRHRMRIGLARTTRLGRARYYEGWEGMWEGVARNAYRFTLLSQGQGAILLGVALLTAMWIPVVLLTYASGWALLSLVIVVLPLVLMLPWYGSLWRVLLAPAAIYAMLPMLAHAVYCVLTTTRVPWKGRRV